MIGYPATTQANLAVGPTHIGPSVRVGINISEWNQAGREGLFDVMAATLLHELGHVYSAIAGSGGSEIKDDASNPGQSDANHLKIIERCLQ